MATYRPSFVDISGFTQGISQGIESAYLQKKQEDALAESKVDEYLKNYRPDKLRDNDIGVFTNNYNNYKQAALQYSKMNRAGAKPEQLALAKTNKDKALSSLNSVYTNSAVAANKMAEYGDYIKRARLAGLDIPRVVTDNYNLLQSNNIDSIKVDSIPSAYDYELIKKDADLKKLDYILNASGAAPVTSSASNKVEITKLGNKPIYAEDKYTITSRPVSSTIKGIRLAMGQDNALKRDAEDLYQIFQQDPYENMKQLQKVIPNISMEEVDPATIYGMQYFLPKVSTPKRDMSGAAMQINAIKYSDDAAYRKAMLELSKRRTAASESAAQIGKRGLIDPAKDLTEFEQQNKGGKGWIKVPDTQAYQGASRFSFQKANVEYMEYNPETQQYKIKTSASAEPKIYTSKEAKYILTENTKGATNKPFVMPNEEQLKEGGYDIDADPELKSILKEFNFSQNEEEGSNE